MFSFLKGSKGSAGQQGHQQQAGGGRSALETPRERGLREARLLRELVRRHANDPAALHALFSHPSSAGQELVRSLNEVHMVLARAAEHTTGEAALAAMLAALDEVQGALSLYYSLPTLQSAAPALPPAPYGSAAAAPPLPATPPLPPKGSSPQLPYGAYPGIPPQQQQLQQLLPPLPQSPSSYYQAQQLHQRQQQQQQQHHQRPQQSQPQPQYLPAQYGGGASQTPSATRVGLDHLLQVDDADWLRAEARATVTVKTADTVYEGEVHGTLADMQQGLIVISGQAAAPAKGNQGSSSSAPSGAGGGGGKGPAGASGSAAGGHPTNDADGAKKKRGLINDITKASPYGLGAIPAKSGETEKGPRQKPRRDVIKLPNNMHTRVVPPSKQRGYDLDGYEEFALIDPKRTMANVLKVDTDWELVDNPPEASDPAIMYEVAAVATKIRNTHKVGGERVKEMQFFVESVETPEVRVKAPDIAPLLQSICEASSLQPITIDGKWPFYIQDKYSPPSESVVAHARILHRLLEIICCEIYTHGMDKVRLCYMTTIRADFSVAAKSVVDGQWYFNVMAFEQQDCCDVASGQLKPDRRPWVYWTERVGMLNGVKPWGLYNKDVRQRLYTYLQALGLK